MRQFKGSKTVKVIILAELRFSYVNFERALQVKTESFRIYNCSISRSGFLIDKKIKATERKCMPITLHEERTLTLQQSVADGPAARPSASALMINGGPSSRNLFALPLDGEPNGDQHAYFFFFTRGEAIHLSQNVAPGRWDKRPPESGGRGRRRQGGGAGIQLEYFREQSKCLAKHLLSRRIKLFPTAL